MKSTTREKLPILHMEGMKDWERWLTGHHESSPGVWLMIAKKGSALTSVSYAEALEAALCHGWIDVSVPRTPSCSDGRVPAI